MVREVMRHEMALESGSVGATANSSQPMWCPAALNVSFANPTVTLLTSDKIVRNLLRRFPSGDLNPVPLSTFVVDEHMRTGTLDS
jgi:hypothetical protein